MNSQHHETLGDQFQITQLILNWGTWRDAGDWDQLRACYTPDATMVTTWWDGPASEFINASEKMRKVQPQDRGGHHIIAGSTIQVNGDRAIAETRITLLGRANLHDQLVDVTVYGRFHDFLMHHQGPWKIKRRVPVYDKDNLQTVVPNAPLVLDAERLESLPFGYRHLAYLQMSQGLPVNTNIAAPLSEAEAAIYNSGQDWLAGETL